MERTPTSFVMSLGPSNWRSKLGSSVAARFARLISVMSGYRKLYLAIAAFTIFMVAVVVQANDYWLKLLARDESRRLVAERSFTLDGALERTAMALEHFTVVSIAASECGYAVQMRCLEGRHLVVMSTCLDTH